MVLENLEKIIKIGGLIQLAEPPFRKYQAGILTGEEMEKEHQEIMDKIKEIVGDSDKEVKKK